jgi:hypothetical protein
MAGKMEGKTAGKMEGRTVEKMAERTAEKMVGSMVGLLAYGGRR